MSMPTFPEENLEITCHQALNMLLGSIAMEELALSHIVNAEGEKLQYVLGTLPGHPCACSSPKEVLEVNRSISDLLERVAYNQLLLKGKLQQVLEAKALCSSPAPPCPPPICTFTAERARPWLCGRALPWRCISGCESRAFWLGCSPTSIHFCPSNSQLASLCLRLRVGQGGCVRVALVGGRGSSLWEGEATATEEGDSLTLSGCVSLPCGVTNSPLQLVLRSPASVILEQASLTLTAIGGTY